MRRVPYRFRAPLWQTPPPGSWHFITLPADLADEIDERTAGRQGGFGSVKVQVTLGGSVWLTSIFPSTEQGSFVLPMKKAVRQAEQASVGDVLDLTLHLVGLEPLESATTKETP